MDVHKEAIVIAVLNEGGKVVEAPSLRHPPRPGLSLASCQLIATAITAGASPLASGLLCLHAVAITPAGSMDLIRSSVSIASGLPRETGRSAPAITFSVPAPRSFTVRPC